MKKLLILLVSVTLVAGACNNKAKSDAEKTTTTDKDTKDDTRDSDSKNDNNDDAENSSSNNARGWSAREVNDFVTSCVNSASSGGMARSAAQKYCDCMQDALEKRYPNPADVISIDMESESMKQLVQDCLN